MPRNAKKTQAGAKPQPKKEPTDARRGSALARAAALAEAPAKAAPLSLSKDEKLRLAEAVRLGEDARRHAETALVSYGQWLLVNVFGDDTTEALQQKRVNGVWQELLALAGGPKLRLSRTSLHLALAIAAYDKRLNDEAFRALDVTRKRALLPLGDDKRIRDAAQHVAATKMTADAAQHYVRALLSARGEAPKLRMTPAKAGARVERAARFFTDRGVLGKWKSQLGDLPEEKRAEAQAHLRSIAKAVAELLDALRKAQ